MELIIMELINMHRRQFLILAALFGINVTPVVFAQDYPVRPIHMVIPFSAGGGTDTPGRILARKMSESLAQPLVVDNRPGAGGTIGTALVAQAANNGYTLLFTGMTHVIGPSVYKQLPYDAINSFAPIVLVGSQPMLLMVHPSLPAKSVPELIALAKAQPDKINFGSSGNGSVQHLAGALFMAISGIKIKHIPYRGNAPAAVALMSGEVSMGIAGVPVGLPHVKSGQLRVLAVTSATRSPVLPDVPTLDEAGVKGYDASYWVGLLAPEGTPSSIVGKINRLATNLLMLPEIEKSFLAVGFTKAVDNTPEQFASYLKVEFDKWRKVIRKIAMKAD